MAAAVQRKRPWYLVLALLASLAFGATGSCSGWRTVTLYRAPIDTAFLAQGVSDEADRAAIVARVEAYVRTLDAARSRGWPIGVATLVLGLAILVLSMRALGGSRGARAVLVQLVVAQAGLNAVGYWLMRDVLEADLRIFEAREAAEIHERVPEKPRADEMSQAAANVMRAANPIALVFRTLGSALVVIALTRRRSREFFEAAAAALEER